MGFLTSSAGTNTLVTNGTGLTVTLPTAVADGDIIFVWFASTAGAATAYVPPSGYTLQGAQKDGTSSFGGRAALYRHTYRSGDTTSPVWSAGGGGTVVWIAVCIKSDVDGDGAGQLVGNPPSSGFGGTYDNERTASAAQLDFAAFNEDGGYDFKLAFYAYTGTGPPTLTQYGSFQDLGGRTSGTLRVGVSQSYNDDAATTATSWTVSAAVKSYTMSVCLVDGSGSVGLQTGTLIEYGYATIEEEAEIIGADAGGIETLYGGGIVVD